MRIIGLLIGALFTFCHANGRQADYFLFDMGTPVSKVESGFIRITPATKYSKERGYGWLSAPGQAFDTTYNRIPDSLFQDGVTGKGSLVFRADVPPGEYFVSLTVGYPREQAMLMEMMVNDSALANITVPWYRLPYRSVRRKVTIGSKGAVVKVKGTGPAQLAGIYSLEFRPVADWPLNTFTKAPETDLSEMTSVALSLEKELRNDPGNSVLESRLDILQKHITAATFYEQAGWSAEVRKTRMSQIQRMYAAIDLLDQVVTDRASPLYYKSLYLLARIHYWLDKEDSELLAESKAPVFFNELSKAFPDHELIRMYQGDQIKDPYVSDVDMQNAPDWARFQREAMGRMLKVIHWWVNQRQAPNGELGGKYADDVEMLRWWLPAILGADDETVRKGYTRLADGIWNSGELVRGYDKKIDDVEHAAELFRDSHAGMFLVRYGDPAYVERAMISMQNFDKVWTGTTHLGHRHFKSYYFSSTETWEKSPYGVDVPLNARALLTGLWAAWYNRNPTLIRQFSEWANAWVADAGRTENGKPSGIIPPAVSFKNERIGGDSDKWYDPGLRYNYYQWGHLGHIAELYSFLNGLHDLTGDKSFLNPINKVAELMTSREEEMETAQPGSLKWVEQTLTAGGDDRTAGANPFGNLFAMTAKLSGDKQYNRLISLYASPYNKYQLTGDVRELLGGFDQILNSLRYNFPLLTSEVKFTDRVYVRGSDLLTGMYTGHFGRGFEYPALVASWKNTGRNVSVFVRKGDRSSAVVSLYNAGGAKQVEMNTWMLAPGQYKLHIGTDENDDTVAEKLIHEALVTIRERVGVIRIALPAKSQVVVRIDPEKLSEPNKTALPDIAIAAGDIQVSKNVDKPGIEANVHNIGNAQSGKSIVYLIVNDSVSDSATVAPIDAPNDLVPRVQTVHFNFNPRAGQNQITVKVKSEGQELNSYNNVATIQYAYTVAGVLPVLPFPQVVKQGGNSMSFAASADFKATGLNDGPLQRLKAHWETYKPAINGVVTKQKQVIELVLLKDLSAADTAFLAKSKPYRDSIGAEGYLLQARSGKITVAANTETGLFYGLQTLRQLTRAGWKQELFIADWPAFATRVIFDDISRGPISTIGYIKKQIERMAELKINYLSFYIEHIVQPLSHPDFAPKDGKLTIPQIRELSAYAEQFHMKLIGSFQSFGHFEKILAVPQYKSMGETGSLISPLDPKARQFLEDVIRELADSFNAPWFNVNCDETFDLNKGKSKAYIDSIGADRFYADHLNFLYGVLKKHNKKMMLWGDVAIQYEKIPEMLPKDVVYLTWEYGQAKSYDHWIKPFASRGLEFMVCPGVLNSYRMFPDMVMAKANIKGFMEAGKAQGATGAFTTLWDDGGTYLFSADWYGVYAAAEKSWNLAVKNETDFDSRYSLAAYGSLNSDYVKSVFKLLELRSLPLTYNMNDVLWQQELLPQKGQSLWLNNTSVPEAKKILAEASSLLANAKPQFNTGDIHTLEHSIAQYTLMMDSRKILASAAATYKQAFVWKTEKPAKAKKLVEQSADAVKRLKERYVVLKNNYRKSWLDENQPYWLDVVMGTYDVKISALAGLETELAKAVKPSGKLVLPAPVEIGFDILETPHTFFTYWLLSGPFPSEKEGSVPSFLYSENKEYNKPPIPGGIATYKRKNYRWHKFASKSGGMIDLSNYFGKTKAATGYAYCTLNVTGKSVDEVFVTSTAGTEVFCDGEKIAAIAGGGNRAVEQRMPVSLGKGTHLFVLKIPQKTGAPWTFSMRLSDDLPVVNTKHKYQTNSKNKTYEVE
ncbi:glycoside hydrolase family 20 zincin-like fold domain-containing protein [Dyadobacter pollutisoli]|uniref:beta-N-acetylhexosaminidase n=1 Tax=Dyadobacter pollutisoli TaxID=2910158 RepID=A0A9E8NFY1_9BACT|nr:glycoside hydrolase family 20 zincin-like fold domain-containing protein [Dyadobacter pollutisoli]WAC13374.1 family 20 glycosylhydrolase [Dyadobacter pollutisoli]